MSSQTHRPIFLGLSDATRAKEVEQEIESFLQALNSYPDRFATNPQLSFEQHLWHVIATNQEDYGQSEIS